MASIDPFRIPLPRESQIRDVDLSEFPFSSLTDNQLRELMYDDVWSKVFSNHQLRDYLFKLNSCDVMKDFNFKYQTGDEFNDSTLSIKDNIELSVLHMNIRSLNAQCTQLCQLLQLVNIQFDIIILSEVWTTNIDCYSNVT